MHKAKKYIPNILLAILCSIMIFNCTNSTEPEEPVDASGRWLIKYVPFNDVQLDTIVTVYVITQNGQAVTITDFYDDSFKLTGTLEGNQFSATSVSGINTGICIITTTSNYMITFNGNVFTAVIETTSQTEGDSCMIDGPQGITSFTGQRLLPAKADISGDWKGVYERGSNITIPF